MHSQVNDRYKVNNEKRPYLFTLYSPISSTRVEEGARENTDELYQLTFYDDGTFNLKQQIFIENKLIREFEPSYSLLKTIEWGWGYRPENGQYIYISLYNKQGHGVCLKLDKDQLLNEFQYYLAMM